MYSAKAAGRRTFRFFEPAMDEGARARRALEQDLRKALAEDGLEVHYQPVVDIASNEITGCEALLRWRHPVRGMVSPAEFIPIAEENRPDYRTRQLRYCERHALRRPPGRRRSSSLSMYRRFNSRRRPLALNVTRALVALNLPAHRLELRSPKQC